jgi:hypothetical protein
MLPIVGALIGQGLSMLASAVQAKGQQVIEEKLGIKIDPSKPENVLALKQLEVDHEEFLMEMAERVDIRELEVFKIETEDKQDARSREVEMAKATGGPYWFPSTITILTFLIMLGGGWMLLNIDAADIKYAVVALMTSVAQYYYGTTKASSEQRQVIAHALERSKS